MDFKYCPSCNKTKAIDGFGKNKSRKGGLQGWCRSCRSHRYYNIDRDKDIHRARCWAKNNTEKRRATANRYNHKRGWGVYKAEYFTGTYIGSGSIQARHRRHMNGNDRIGKTLKQGALKFTVLLRCSKENCLMYEQLIIDHYGMSNLLNSQKAVK